MHFENRVEDAKTGNALSTTARKLVVLIHGYNSRGLFDQITTAETIEFQRLSNALKAALASSDWGLVLYRWERDSDTGQSLVPIDEAIRAAEIGHQHGQHLGELLAKGFPDIEKVQLIAHSAGAWAGRSAARYILKNVPSCAVQVTLLDPFVPGVISAPPSTALVTAVMAQFDSVEGSNQLKTLENYFADEVASLNGLTFGTQEKFAWNRPSDRNVRVDGTVGSPVYSAHDGPIQFYADTVSATLPGQIPAASLTPFDIRPGSTARLGWTRSLFYNEPLIQQNPQSQVAVVGSPVTLIAVAASRNRNAADSTVSYQWRRNGVAIPGANGATFQMGAVRASDAGVYSVTVSNAWGSTISAAATIVVSGTAPTITSQPQAQTVNAGQPVTFSVSATGSPAPLFQWSKNGIPVVGATGASFTINAAQPSDAGSYAVFVSNDMGSATSASVTLAVNYSRLVNLSILTTVHQAVPLVTVGAVIGGVGTSGVNPLLVRAAGPALAQFGVRDPLPDPKLDLISNQKIIASNDNWGVAEIVLTSAFSQVGAFGFGSALSKDAAIFSAALPAGSYTMQVTGVGGAIGNVIAELYDATPVTVLTGSTPRLINVSVLKQTTAGETLTAGFVISGTLPKTVLIRAVGPTLGIPPFSIPGVMEDPRLDLFSGQTLRNANDNWGGDFTITSAFVKVGAFSLASASRDAVLLVTLNPGSYTAQVTGANASAGFVLVEVYEVP
ncbi:MAG: immunoglobulin domain-containing protein [Opitutaceae bacterium]